MPPVAASVTDDQRQAVGTAKAAKLTMACRGAVGNNEDRAPRGDGRRREHGGDPSDPTPSRSRSRPQSQSAYHQNPDGEQLHQRRTGHDMWTCGRTHWAREPKASLPLAGLVVVSDLLSCPPRAICLIRYAETPPCAANDDPTAALASRGSRGDGVSFLGPGMDELFSRRSNYVVQPR